MANTLTNVLTQANVNTGANTATAASQANSGLNVVAGGLAAINAANPATSTAVAFNAAPVTQTNFAFDPDVIFDPDGIDIG